MSTITKTPTAKCIRPYTHNIKKISLRRDINARWCVPGTWCVCLNHEHPRHCLKQHSKNTEQQEWSNLHNHIPAGDTLTIFFVHLVNYNTDVIKPGFSYWNKLSHMLFTNLCVFYLKERGKTSIEQQDFSSCWAIWTCTKTTNRIIDMHSAQCAADRVVYMNFVMGVLDSHYILKGHMQKA